MKIFLFGLKAHHVPSILNHMFLNMKIIWRIQIFMNKKLHKIPISDCYIDTTHPHIFQDVDTRLCKYKSIRQKEEQNLLTTTEPPLSSTFLLLWLLFEEAI